MRLSHKYLLSAPESLWYRDVWPQKECWNVLVKSWKLLWSPLVRRIFHCEKVKISGGFFITHCFIINIRGGSFECDAYLSRPLPQCISLSPHFYSVWHLFRILGQIPAARTSFVSIHTVCVITLAESVTELWEVCLPLNSFHSYPKQPTNHHPTQNIITFVCLSRRSPARAEWQSRGNFSRPCLNYHRFKTMCLLLVIHAL